MNHPIDKVIHQELLATTNKASGQLIKGILISYLDSYSENLTANRQSEVISADLAACKASV